MNTRKRLLELALNGDESAIEALDILPYPPSRSVPAVPKETDHGVS